MGDDKDVDLMESELRNAMRRRSSVLDDPVIQRLIDAYLEERLAGSVCSIALFAELLSKWEKEGKIKRAPKETSLRLWIYKNRKKEWEQIQALRR